MTPVSGLCLIVEDDPWIAFDLADYVSFSGYVLAGPFTTCRETLAYLKNQTPTLAIIDIKVLDGSSRLIIEKLTQKGVPFIIYSGYSRKHFTYTEIGSHTEWIQKPASAEKVLSAAERLLIPS
ncbi:response regulator [Methylocapsa palsarum]|uniref:Response regulator receiver domain-containing protein n=1 Tax=Methylocapsa palsarum TaxID=1612308 RepID=A0A1I3XQF3_9HYPH|nr:response regulator [Methylocapsa palsarum]SFK21762.1 Response regulator receiver domain-containing protein [Methylocapsa palsarum]